MVKISSEETPDSFIPLKLLKSEVRADRNGMFVVMEFVDNNGVRLKTPDIPYPEHFDPMNADINAEYRGDEIKIKSSDGQTIMSVFATSVEYDNPVATCTNPNGRMFIEAEEGEDSLPVRTFSLSQGEESEVGFSQAFERANRERQQLDDAVISELNSQYPQVAPRTVGASAWMREQQERVNPNSDLFIGQEIDPSPATPKIKIDFDMKCTCCEGKIHYPDKLVQLLGNEGTIKYLEFCKKTGGEPQMFCCECYGIMGRNSRIITAVNKMNEKIKDMMDLKDREEEVTKREEELDKQLKKK